jgi:membrane associated rhomboid family serine protease
MVVQEGQRLRGAQEPGAQRGQGCHFTRVDGRAALDDDRAGDIAEETACPHVLDSSCGLLFCAPMEIHLPDPDYTGSARARANFRLAAWTSLGFVALLWLVPLLGWGLGLESFGIRPRQWIGLPGILVAPLLHVDFSHLIANSLPLVVLGTAMFHVYPSAAFRVLPAVYLVPGIAVWLFARDGVHVGASGLVFGLVSYIFVAGLIRRDRRAMATSLLVAFMYGSVAWGMLPINPRISWETHLAAALVGVIMAVLMRRRDNPPRVRYSWEDEAEENVDEPIDHDDFPAVGDQGGNIAAR